MGAGDGSAGDNDSEAEPRASSTRFGSDNLHCVDFMRSASDPL